MALGATFEVSDDFVGSSCVIKESWQPPKLKQNAKVCLSKTHTMHNLALHFFYHQILWIFFLLNYQKENITSVV